MNPFNDIVELGGVAEATLQTSTAPFNDPQSNTTGGITSRAS
jgi:hypothetical protein